MTEGVSFVIPVHGAPRELEAALRAIAAQDAPAGKEVVMIDDGAHDSARAILESWSKDEPFRLVEGERRGAAAALNTGIRAARYPWIAQVDQDVILGDDWLMQLLSCATDPTLGAAQGYWLTARTDSLWARVSGLDLEERYGRLTEGATDHVCTGQTLYRKRALEEVGLFDESMGYGYDNDMSYRLQSAGYGLALCRAAESRHLWPETAAGYFRQQYGQGYGRLDLISRHPPRASGDRVSDWMMILHVPLSLAALSSLAVGLASSILGRSAVAAYAVCLASLSILVMERSLAGWRSWRQRRDPAAFLFVPAHAFRDLAWLLALGRWSLRRLFGQSGEPRHSMLDKSPEPPRIDDKKQG